MPERTAADAFLDQLIAADVEYVFGNPGTNEQPVLGRIEARPELRYIVALHEGVAVGAAEGYARASGKPGVVQLHAGPGLGNGMGMLHNARAGQTPLVVYVGQAEQQTLFTEPTLGANLVDEAASVSKWAYEVRTPAEIPQVLRRALKVAMAPPRGPVVLSIPMDLLEQPCGAEAMPASYVETRVRPDAAAVVNVAGMLRAARAPVILVGDGVAASGAIVEVGRFAKAIGAPIFGAFTSEVCVDPADPLDAGRLPSIDGAAAIKRLAPYDLVLAIGTKLFSHVFPVTGLPLADHPLIQIGLDPWELGKNQPGTLLLADERSALCDLLDATAAWPAEALATAADRGRLEAERIATARDTATASDRDRRWEGEPPTLERAIAEVAGGAPSDAIVVDESLTGYAAVGRSFRQGPGRWFRLRGGGIGAGMALPIGIQLARPGQPVLSLVGDGAAIYTLSSLWTAAHHDLPVVWGVLNNRSYATLKENARRGAPQGVDVPVAGSDLVDPELDFVALAKGMGVEAERVSAADQIAPAFERAFAAHRPFLVDIAVRGDPQRP